MKRLIPLVLIVGCSYESGTTHNTEVNNNQRCYLGPADIRCFDFGDFAPSGESAELGIRCETVNNEQNVYCGDSSQFAAIVGGETSASAQLETAIAQSEPILEGDENDEDASGASAADDE